MGHNVLTDLLLTYEKFYKPLPGKKCSSFFNSLYMLPDRTVLLVPLLTCFVGFSCLYMAYSCYSGFNLYRSWKTWKVMEFFNFVFQARKALEFKCGSWKAMENDIY